MKARLTKRTVDATKPAERDVIVWDTDVPGFALKVTPKGRKTFFAYYRMPDGQQRRPRVGTYGEVTVDEARALARKWISGARDGKDASAERQEARKAVRVEELADDFLERYAKVKNRAWRDTEGILRLYVKPAWGSKRVEALTKHDVIKLLDRIEAKASVYRRNRVLACIRKMMAWAAEKHSVDTPDLPKHASGEISRDRHLAPDEVRLVWRAAERLGYPFGHFVRFLLATGQRRGEVADIQRGDNIDTETDRLWTLVAEKTKAKRMHPVPLNDLALDILKDCPEIDGCPFVFSSGFVRQADQGTVEHRPISGFGKAKKHLDAEILKILREDAETAGRDPKAVKPLPEWRLHDLRRTVATDLEGERLGFAPYEVGVFVLNHDPRTYKGITAVYTRDQHLLPRRRLQNTWARYLRLMLDAEAWASVEAHLREKDGEGSEAVETRYETFQRAIREGGETWAGYLRLVAQGEGAPNVVALRPA